MIGLSGMKGLDSQGPALKLSPLHGEVDITTALIAGYNGKFCPECFLQKLRDITF